MVMVEVHKIGLTDVAGGGARGGGGIWGVWSVRVTWRGVGIKKRRYRRGESN